ncbi:MAG: DKNYY domain-containing protein, partial [Candidatus Moranbacteria bacterium]|nr:DKNYY domain-containing protein [Candidatus Moranbacteria bacterium]
MKKIFLVFGLCLVFFGCGIEELQLSNKEEKFEKNIKVDQDKKIDLGGGYSKDDKYIFYHSHFLNADFTSFEVIDSQYHHYAKDKDHVYYTGKIIDGADQDSFEVLNYNYSRDKKHIYFYGQILDKNFHSSTFKVFNYSYIEDKNGIYFYNSMNLDEKFKKVEEVDTETFEVIIGEYDDFGLGNERFARDRNNIYYIGEKKDYIDVSTFVILDKLYSKDANNVYFHSNIIEGADSKTFEIIESEKSFNEFTKDEKDIYQHGLKIK